MVKEGKSLFMIRAKSRNKGNLDDSLLTEMLFEFIGKGDFVLSRLCIVEILFSEAQYNHSRKPVDVIGRIIPYIPIVSFVGGMMGENN